MRKNVYAVAASLFLFAGATSADARPSRDTAHDSWNPFVQQSSSIASTGGSRQQEQRANRGERAAYRGRSQRVRHARASLQTQHRRIPRVAAATRLVAVRALGAAGGCARSAAAVLTSTSPGTGASGAARAVRRSVPSSSGVTTSARSLAVLPTASGWFVPAMTAAQSARVPVRLRAPCSRVG